MEFSPSPSPSSSSPSTTIISNSNNNSSKSVLFKNSTVLFPTITHGNIGQLACDLLIYNMQMKPIGALFHTDVLPICGSNPYCNQNDNQNDHQNQNASSLEIYGNEDLSLIVCQQRGEVNRGCQRKFAKDVIYWLKTNNFKKVIVLASLPSTVGENDSQIGGTKWRTIQTPNIITESYPTSSSNDNNNNVTNDEDDDEMMMLPKAFEFEQIPEDLKHKRIPPWTFVYQSIKQSLSANFIIALCSEGDNSIDADRMASRALAMVAEKNVEIIKDGGGKTNESSSTINFTNITLPPNGTRWKTPPSWRRVYGGAIKRSIFA